MERIEISTIKPGIRFSKPVFFDDGKNMFIESGIFIKPYHMAALTKWHIPFLLSDGHIMEADEELVEEPEELFEAEELPEVELEVTEDLTEELDAVESLETGVSIDFLEDL